VKVTLFLPTMAGAAGRSTGLGALALAAEDAGFWGVAFSEHPAPSRKWLEGGGHDSYDPMLALAYCAAATSTIRLVPCVSVLPYRNPLLSAKSIATLDILSGGRLTLIVGAGYLRSEFRALGVEFEDRNELLDEAIDVIRQLWLDDSFVYHGKHFTANGQVSSPPPVQRPHPPIWIGGNSLRARQKAAAVAAGWAPMQLNAAGAATARTRPMYTVSEVADAIADLRQRLDAQGRASDTFDIQLQAPAADFADPGLSIPERQEILRQLAAAGVTHVLAFLPHGDQETVLKFIERDGAQFVKGLPTSPARTQPER
jgi:probable F420-dependent oxidoreductase